MRNQWKRLAAILGAAMLMASQNGIMEVRAEEPPTPEETLQQEGAGGKEDISQKPEEDGAKTVMPENGGETGEESTDTEDPEAEPRAMSEETADTGADARTAQIEAVTNLRWSDTGEAVFYNPNNFAATFIVHIFKDGAYPGGQITTCKGSADSSGDVSVSVPFGQYGVGTYTFKVMACTDADGKKIEETLNYSLTSGLGVVSEESGEYVYPNPDIQQISAADILVWRNDQKTGMAYFKNPNDRGATYVVYVYRDQERIGASSYDSGDYEKDGFIPLYLFELAIEESGDYTFEVETRDANGTLIGKACSETFSYAKPQKQLSTPGNISWDKDGIFSCDWTGEEDLDTYSFIVSGPGVSVPMFGSNPVQEKVGIEIKNGRMEFNLNRFLEAQESYDIRYLDGASVRVKAVSSDLDVCQNSEWSSRVAFGNGPVAPEEEPSGSSPSSERDRGENKNTSASVIPEGWKPTTPDEIRRYEAYSREKVEFTTDKENAYTVTIQNAMQGKLCFDSFEAVLGDYTIGRTYNIFPSGKASYKMDGKARIILNIPKALQAPGREFKMICVTEKGMPVILEDLDTVPETITFETDTYYAFALVYKDAAAAK